MLYCFSFSQIAVSGSRSKDYFGRHGDLKRIRRLKFWPMDSLLIDNYQFTKTGAQGLLNFLCPLLDFEPEHRPTASQCLVHQWITDS
jgi:serine/threonine-protein kinase SRPK3